MAVTALWYKQMLRVFLDLVNLGKTQTILAPDWIEFTSSAVKFIKPMIKQCLNVSQQRKSIVKT